MTTTNTVCISYLHCRWYSYVGSTLCHGETPGLNCTFPPWLSAMRKWISITMQRSVFRQCTFLLSHLPVVRHCTFTCIDSWRHLKIIHFQYPISQFFFFLYLSICTHVAINIQSLVHSKQQQHNPGRGNFQGELSEVGVPVYSKKLLQLTQSCLLLPTF